MEGLDAPSKCQLVHADEQHLVQLRPVIHVDCVCADFQNVLH